MPRAPDPLLHRSFYLHEWQVQALKHFHDEDGVLPSEQVRRALTGEFQRKGYEIPEAARRRTDIRRRT